MVAEYPDNWAIVTDAESLTYAELNERANRVAHSIIDQRGIGVEPIGRLFERKLNLAVAMLGVLKTGKFFVLLDPAWPESRLRVILNDTQAKLILTEDSTTAIAWNLDNQVTNIDRVENRACAAAPQLLIAPETLLSISYTSGTTAEPKGIVRNHRSLLHQVMLYTNEYHHCDRDRMSYLSSGTAAAVNRLFMSLLVGATILPFDVKRHGLDALAAWLKGRRNLDLFIEPSCRSASFRTIQTGQFDLPNLRVLRLASEPAYKSDFELYRQRFPLHCLLANSVSPSETSLLSVYLMHRDSVIETNDIPIGYPVKDKEVLLIDDSGNDVGLNQIGEIAVRSSYLAQGYWNRPELTAVKFTSTNCDVAARLYRTGDLGPRRPDGCLIHKGR